MSCCCDNPYVLGCANVCSQLTINYISPIDATYSLVANYLGSVIHVDADIAAGAPLVFDLSGLNEYYKYSFTVYVNGNYIDFVDADLNPYQCFEVTLRPFGGAVSTVELF